jgi:hypothetical protein
MRFFVSDIWSKNAEGASGKSHGRNSWSQKSKKFTGFDRKETNLENKGSPKRLDIFLL